MKKGRKCEFGIGRIEYVGHVVESDTGVKMNPKKVDALLGMQRPQNGEEWERWLMKDARLKKQCRKFRKSEVMTISPSELNLLT